MEESKENIKRAKIYLILMIIYFFYGFTFEENVKGINSIFWPSNKNKIFTLYLY